MLRYAYIAVRSLYLAGLFWYLASLEHRLLCSVECINIDSPFPFDTLLPATRSFTYFYESQL